MVDQDKIDVILGVTNSAVGLAVSQVTREKNGILLATGPATSALTGAACSPNTIHWADDTYALAAVTAKSVVQAGGDTWFFITADYAFGHQMQRDATAVIEANGGMVVGNVNVPMNTADFSSYLLQAQNSKAKVVALANAGGDALNSIKQAREFGLTVGGQRLAPLALIISDVNVLGLEVAQGLIFTSTFYWDLNDGTREFSLRFSQRIKSHHMPTRLQAAAYASLRHYLKTVEALGGNSHDGAKIVANMKQTPTDDPLFGKGAIRADGRTIHPAYLFEVKKPSESKYPWDYYKLVATVPGDEAFRPLAQSECPLVTK
jgi:branched-chain amino acid transport system substrate-binding protein